MQKNAQRKGLPAAAFIFATAISLASALGSCGTGGDAQTPPAETPPRAAAQGDGIQRPGPVSGLRYSFKIDEYSNYQYALLVEWETSPPGNWAIGSGPVRKELYEYAPPKGIIEGDCLPSFVAAGPDGEYIYAEYQFGANADTYSITSQRTYYFAELNGNMSAKQTPLEPDAEYVFAIVTYVRDYAQGHPESYYAMPTEPEPLLIKTPPASEVERMLAEAERLRAEATG